MTLICKVMNSSLLCGIKENLKTGTRACGQFNHSRCQINKPCKAGSSLIVPRSHPTILLKVVKIAFYLIAIDCGSSRFFLAG